MFEREVHYPAAYTSAAPSDDPEILIALQWLVRQRENVGGDILVLATGLDNFQHSTVVQRYKAGLTLASETTFKRSGWSGGPAMALWPTPKGLALLDDSPRTRALVAVPWLMKDLEAWIASRRPVDVLGAAPQAGEPTISDPVVRVALQHLTNAVNLSSGLHHPSDKARAVETFRVLKKKRYSWNPDEIHAWALTHGWDNDGAGDLRKYAAGVLEGRGFRTTGPLLRPDVVDRWRDEAAKAP